MVRQAIYAYTLVCPQLARCTSLILPYANTQMMNLFLRQVADDFKEYKLIVQIDQAGWHKSKDLQIPQNIALIEQPPYSPELNPVEHLWEEIREKFLDNHIFDSMEKLINQLSDALKAIANYGQKLTSMTYFEHLNVLL